MSKQLIRIKSKDIFNNLSNLIGIEIHVVLHNGIPFVGLLTEIDSKRLSIRDFRSHPHAFLIEEVYEVIYDKKKPLTV